MKGFLYVNEREDPDAMIKQCGIIFLFMGGFVVLSIITGIVVSAAVFLTILGLHILSYGVSDFITGLGGLNNDSNNR